MLSLTWYLTEDVSTMSRSTVSGKSGCLIRFECGLTAFSDRDIIELPILLLGQPVLCHVSSGDPLLTLTVFRTKPCAPFRAHC